MVFLFFSQFIFVEAVAEQPAVDTKETGEKKSSFFKDLLEDEGKILTAPFRMKGKSMLTWGSVALITAVLIKNDEELYRRTKVYRQEHEWVDWLSPRVTVLGDGGLNLGIAACFYVSGVIFKDEKAKETAKLSLMSLIHAGVLVQLLKHLAGRQRPKAANGEDHWEGPAGFFKRYKDNRDMFYDAFPSGHAITAWSAATVIAHMYNKSFVVPALCYSLATLASLSRVTEDEHWYSDVFIGAVLGFAIGKLVVKKRGRRFNAAPLIQGDKIGLSIYYLLD